MGIKPRGFKSHYVGVEIEFLSYHDIDEASSILQTMGMNYFCDIVDDGSVESDDPDLHSMELRLVCRQFELRHRLKMVQDFLDTVADEINETCGLHVHLDMRNRNPRLAHSRLLSVDTIMTKMVPRERLTSGYCFDNANLIVKPRFETSQGKLVPFSYTRYCGVNILAYHKHRTIEIRYHEGTFNTVDIFNWCKFLINTIEGKKVDNEYVKERINRCS